MKFPHWDYSVPFESHELSYKNLNMRHKKHLWLVVQSSPRDSSEHIAAALGCYSEVKEKSPLQRRSCMSKTWRIWAGSDLKIASLRTSSHSTRKTTSYSQSEHWFWRRTYLPSLYSQVSVVHQWDTPIKQTESHNWQKWSKQEIVRCPVPQWKHLQSKESNPRQWIWEWGILHRKGWSGREDREKNVIIF